MVVEAVSYELRRDVFVHYELNKKRKAKGERRKAKGEKRKAKSEKRKAKGEKRNNFASRFSLLVPIVFRLVRTVFGNPDIIGLFIR